MGVKAFKKHKLLDTVTLHLKSQVSCPNFYLINEDYKNVCSIYFLQASISVARCKGLWINPWQSCCQLKVKVLDAWPADILKWGIVKMSFVVVLRARISTWDLSLCCCNSRKMITPRVLLSLFTVVTFFWQLDISSLRVLHITPSSNFENQCFIFAIFGNF